MASFKVQKDLPSLGFKVFDILSLVQYHVIPFLSSKNWVICDGYLITCNADMETVKF